MRYLLSIFVLLTGVLLSAPGDYIWDQQPSSGPLVPRRLTPAVGKLIGWPTSVNDTKAITLGTNLTLTAQGVLNATGGVASIGLAVPSGLSVSGSPLTSSGTLTISTTLSGVLKGTGSGFAAAVAGTDYLAPTGNGSGLTGLTAGQISGLGTLATQSGTFSGTSSGTNTGDQTITLTVPTGLSVTGSPLTASGTLAITTTLSGVLKGTGSGFAAAVAGTDYLAPTGNGSGLTGITAGQISGLGTLATQSGTFSGTSSGTNTGDQTITLSGDVSGSGTGAITTTIGASKVLYTMLAGSIPDSKLDTLTTAGKVAN